MCQKEPDKFWQEIKILGPQKPRNIPMKVYVNNIVSNDKSTVLQVWQQEFQKLYNPELVQNATDVTFKNTISNLKHNIETNPEIFSYEENFVLNCPITIDEVRKACTSLKSKKTPGIDKIPNEVLKNKSLLNILQKLLSFCFEKGIVPDNWLKAIIKPIPKSGNKDPYVPLNYRGISLLSCVGKLYTSILGKRLTKYLDLLGIIAEEQNGFRAKRSCEDHIYSLTSIIQSRKEQNLDTFAAFIDFSKAFDSVNRDFLLYKLLNYNIQGKMYNAIKSLYMTTSSRLNLNGYLTEWFESMAGVRQGDNLSPLLFNIFLNDLVNELKSLNLGIKFGHLKICMLLYADDIVLISDNENHLQKMLSHVHTWCKKWQLSINTDKTQVVHFRKKTKQRSKYTFKIGQQIIQTVPKYKYLGIFVDEFLTFNDCAQILADSSGRALGAVVAKFKELSNCGYKSFVKLYNCNVVPVLSYGAAIWGFNMDKAAEKIHNQALRYFMGVNKYAPNMFLQGDSGWLPPKYIFHKAMLRYWNRLCSLDNSVIAKQIFNCVLHTGNTNSTWMNNVKQIFQALNLMSAYRDRRKVNLKICDIIFNTMTKDNWKLNILLKPKLCTYRLKRM